MQVNIQSTFRTTGALDEHIQANHKRSKPADEFKYDQCDSCFGAQFQLRKHVTHKHNQIRITCKECGFTVHSLEHMRKHMDVSVSHT